jgi:hypothetical protein
MCFTKIIKYIKKNMGYQTYPKPFRPKKLEGAKFGANCSECKILGNMIYDTSFNKGVTIIWIQR